MSDFLKPNKFKLVIFGIIFTLSIFIFIRLLFLGFIALGSFEGFEPNYSFLSQLTIYFGMLLLWPALIGIFFPVPLIGALFNLLAIPLLLLYWYLIACLVTELIKKRFFRKI